MKRTLFFIILLGLVIWLAILFKTHPGSVTIMTPHAAIHVQLWFAIVVILLAFVALHYLWRLLKFTLGWPRRWRQKRAQQRLVKSILLLASGDNAEAQTLASETANTATNPFLHYLVAAFAAQQQQNTDLRDQWLQAAYNLMPDAKLALGLLKAQWQLQTKEFENALATLNQLQEIAPKQPRLLQLLTELYLTTHQWEAIIDLQPQLTKLQVFTKKRFTSILQECYQQFFIECTDLKQLENLWKTAPKPLQTDLQTIYVYVLALLRNKQFARAEELITKTLKAQWNWALIRLYGGIDVGDARDQFAMAQSWLTAHPHDPDLYYTLGRLAVRNQQLEQAETYFKQSLELRPDPEVYACYAQALENNGEQKESFMYYRRGLLQYLQQNKDHFDTQVTLTE